MRVASFLAFSTAALLAPACSRTRATATPAITPSELHHSRLTAAEATEMALQEARRQEMELEQYAAPAVRFSWSGSEATWHVDFVGRDAVPGNHFSVDIADRDGSARVHLGG